MSTTTIVVQNTEMQRESLRCIARNTVGRTHPGLMSAIELSFGTPQFGPFHCEGPTMDSHLWLIHETLRDAMNRHFHPNVPLFIGKDMEEAAHRFNALALQHLLLHDLEKITTLTFVFTDGRKEAITLEQWAEMMLRLHESLGITELDEKTLRDFCTGRGIAQISYYQDVDGKKISHGKKAADRLRELGGFDDLLIRGIETHEIAFQFGERRGINIPLFERTFGDLGDLAIDYMCLVNYCDQMSSLRENGQPDISDFLWMVRSYEAWQKFQVVIADINAIDRLDNQKVQRALAALRDSTDAFQNEGVDAVVERIVTECKLPTVTESQVRDALAPAIAEGLDAELVERIVTEMTTDGKIASDTGDKLGRFNRLVRPALAKLGG